MKSWLPPLAVALLGLGLSSQTAAYVAVWRSDLSLWAWAVHQAPEKPRPWINLGGALALRGRWQEAETAWRIAGVVAERPWVPAWDRRTAQRLVALNLETLRQVPR